MATNISTIVLDAHKQKIWDALTKPELVKLWQYGSALHTNWAIGDKIEFVAEWNGQVFKQWGTVLEFKPTQRLAYNLFAPRPELEDKPENYFIMKYNLTELNGKTKLEIIQEDNRPNSVQEEPQGEENPILQELKKVIETH